MPNFDVNGFVNAWNTQSTERIVEYYADDAEMIVPPDKEAYRGKEGIRQNVREVTTAFENLNGDVAWSAQQGDKVAMLVHLSGRHTGEMTVSDQIRIPPSNRDVRIMLGVFLELNAQGKIKREIDLADNLGILQQVGAMEKAMGGARATGTTGVGGQAGRTR